MDIESHSTMQPWMPDPSTICSLATSVIGSPCHFILETENKAFSGGGYLVYPLESASKSRICVRIPKESTNPHIGLLVEREANIRRRIDAAQINLIQPLIASDSTMGNPLRTPVLVLGWANGRPLKWSDTRPASECERRQVLHAVANASLDLLRIHETGKAALDWIRSKINRRIIRAEAGELPGVTPAECRKQMQLMQKYWIPELDTAPHVLVHGDISGNNVIVDEHYNVQSLIDFGWAEFVPLQFAAVYPRFLTHEPEKGQAFDWTRRNTKQMEWDRAFYLQCIKTRASREGGVMLDYLRVLSREDEISRYWWLTAASRIDIHKAMISCDWVPPLNA